MQFPQLLSPEGVTSKAKLVWARIVISRLTVVYFVFSVLHFVIQLSLQLRTFTANAEAATFLGNVIVQGNATTDWLPILRGSNVSVCGWVSSNLDTDVETCKLVWSAEASETEDNDQNSSIGGFPLNLPVSLSPSPAPVSTSSSLLTSSPSTSTSSSSSSLPLVIPSPVDAAISTTSASRRIVATTTISPSTTTVFVTATSTPEKDDGRRRSVIARRGLQSSRVDDNGEITVKITSADGQEGTLDGTCLEALNWPLSIIRNTKREDIVFVAFQFWVLGMSIVALMNESIPHILASLLTHVMATAWAAFQITHTANFRASFNQVITNGACKGAPAILPAFWEARAQAEYPSLAMHVLSLLISCFLTWKLVKLFGWQTFKRVGASLTINRVYKIVLTLSITIQLALFFMVVTVSLWIDQLMNSAIGDLASFTTLYKVTSFTTLAILVPWLWLGWVSVRKELRLPMFFFLVIAIIYLAGWGAMFFCTTFRWSFVTWRFFSIMACASVLLTCMSFILGVVCRFNFGKGLLRYLGPHQTLDEDDDQSSIYGEKKDIESFAFPTAGSLVPTYASTYTPEELPYRYELPSAAQGPRFFNRDAQPFEAPKFELSPPPAALTRNLTDVSPVKRSNSNGSDRTISTYRSYSSSQIANDHSRKPSHSSQTKRWVIE